jgi:Arm DNA-binding domain
MRVLSRVGSVDQSVGRDMARKIGRLTALEASRLSEPGMHPDGGGLYLQNSKTRARSWVLRFKHDGRYMGLGPCHAVSLADARQKAAEARSQLDYVITHAMADPRLDIDQRAQARWPSPCG